MPETNVDSFIEELNGGVFKEKLSYLLSSTAQGTILHGGERKKGKVSLEFTFTPIGENEQVKIKHKLSHSTPTKRGNASEEDTTETPMFVGKGGALSVAPPKEEQSGQLTLSQESDGIRSVK